MKKSELKALILECKEELAEEKIEQLVMEDADELQAKNIVAGMEKIMKYLAESITKYKDAEIDEFEVAKQLELLSREFTDSLPKI
jgi:hypothetical protein